MDCPRCSTAVLAHVRQCHVCGMDVGCPNIRAAQVQSEVDALAQSVYEARRSAEARKCLPILEPIHEVVESDESVVILLSA